MKAAQNVTQAEHRLPWLLSAQYDAQIDDLQMVGTADLMIHNPHEIASWASVSPWTLPLHSVDDEHNFLKEPIFCSVNERVLGLLTKAKSSQSHRLHWSIQGEERSDGRWFQFQIPSCPQATMNIVIPRPYRLDWPSARQHLRGRSRSKDQPHDVGNSSLAAKLDRMCK
ncbi:MAG: hypothetical protein QM703_08150 [Gemmatales bacterium]